MTLDVPDIGEKNDLGAAERVQKRLIAYIFDYVISHQT
jgi:hypothetical protein